MGIVRRRNTLFADDLRAALIGGSSLGCALSLACFCAACGDDGAARSMDATVDRADPEPIDSDAALDTGPVDGGDGASPVCGDGTRAGRESCDDGNLEPGDGCDERCHRDAYCGDGEIDPAEVCDDANNAAGDGCAPDCRTDERCGDGRVDPASGEWCDDGGRDSGDGCDASCAAEACEATECVDADPSLWDGCAPDCTRPDVFVLGAVAITTGDDGCDLDGDGEPDNAMARALAGTRTIINEQISTSLANGRVPRTIAALFGRTSRSREGMHLAYVLASDTDADPANDFGGDGLFRVNADPAPAFIEVVQSGAELSGGPADLSYAVPINAAFSLDVLLRVATVSGTLQTDGTPARLTATRICGAVPVASLAAARDPTELVPGGGAAVACEGDSVSLADLAIAGATVVGIRTRPTDPDIDLDGDGLETFEIAREGPAGCRAVVSACLDGDGTRVEGHDCLFDPRIADGLSASLDVEGIAARLTL